MKCGFCGADNNLNAKFCISCGKKFKHQKKEDNQKEKISIENSKFKHGKGKKKKIIIGIVLLVVLLVLVAFIVVIKLNKKPMDVFKTTMVNIYEDYNKKVTDDYDSFYMNLEISPEINGSGNIDVDDMFKNFYLQITGGIDYKNEKFTYNFITKYKDGELFNTDIQYDDEFYLTLNNLFDRSIIIEESDFSDLFVKADLKSTKIVLKKIIDAFNDSFKEEYFESNREKITFDGREINTKVSTLNLSKENAKAIDEDASKRLASDDEFINAYANVVGDTKENVKDSLKTEDSYDYYEDTKVKLYTSTLNSNLLRAEIIVDDIIYQIDLLGKNNDVYKIAIIYGGITMTFNFKCDFEYGKSIDLKEINNPITFEEFTLDMLNQITSNIKNQEGYKLLDNDVTNLTMMSIEELLSLFLGTNYKY